MRIEPRSAIAWEEFRWTALTTDSESDDINMTLLAIVKDDLRWWQSLTSVDEGVHR